MGYKGEDGYWYELPNPGIWNSVGIMLRPGGEYSFETRLNPALNNNRPGIYRLYKQVSFEGERQNFWIMTEFRLH